MRTRCCACSSRPGARTRSACTSRTWASPWSATRRTAAGGAWSPAPAPGVVAALQAFRRQALHAARLAFEHPLERQRRWNSSAPLPADMRALLAPAACRARRGGGVSDAPAWLQPRWDGARRACARRSRCAAAARVRRAYASLNLGAHVGDDAGSRRGQPRARARRARVAGRAALAGAGAWRAREPTLDREPAPAPVRMPR